MPIARVQCSEHWNGDRSYESIERKVNQGGLPGGDMKSLMAWRIP